MQRTSHLNILVVQTAFIGDSLLAIPLLKKLRSLDEKGFIEMVCRPGLGDFFLKTKLVDHVVEWDKKMDSLEEVAKRLSRPHYDYQVVPHHSFRSFRLSRRISSDRIFAFKRWWNFLSKYSTVRDKELPDALRQISLLSPIDDILKNILTELRKNQPNTGWGQDSIDFDDHDFPEVFSMKLEIFEKTDQNKSHFLKIDEYPVGSLIVAPGSVWKTKCWPEDNYVELITKWISSSDRSVILLGSQKEYELCQRIRERLQSPRVMNLAGRLSLFESFLLLQSKALLAITNDSGTMHLAAAAGVRTVSIFGPTTLDIGYRPWQKNALVIQTPLSCRPCGKHGHNKCPIQTHDCMKKISPEFVDSQIQF